MTKPLLEVRGLSVRFTRGAITFNAVDSVHFSLARHETLGVVGGSGSGKSTLARAILQLVPKCAGTHPLRWAGDRRAPRTRPARVL